MSYPPGLTRVGLGLATLAPLLAINPRSGVEVMAALATIAAGLVIVRKGWRGACAWVVAAGRAHEPQAFDGWVLDTLDRDSRTPAPRIRDINLRAHAPDIRSRDVDIESAHLAAAATDRKMDSIANAHETLALALAPLARLPEFAVRIEEQLKHIGSTIEDVRATQGEHGDQLRDHGEAIAAWDGHERRTSGHTDRRDDGNGPHRGGGRRGRDHRPA